MDYKTYPLSQYFSPQCNPSSEGNSPGYERPRRFSRFAYIIAAILGVQLCVDVWTAAPNFLRLFPATFPDGLTGQAQQVRKPRVSSDCGQTGLQNRFTEHQRSPATAAASRERVQKIMQEFALLITYIPLTNTVFFTMPKAGSTTYWRTVYIGMTGRTWSKADCGTVQKHSSKCWQPYVRDVLTLPADEQFRLIVGNQTKRVAIQREPFSRLVSAYKNKLACNKRPDEGQSQAHRLRRLAGLPPGAACMNVSEYADALDCVRIQFEHSGDLRFWRKLDTHFVPQNYYANDIVFHQVLDVADLSNLSRLHPLLDPLPFAHLAKQAGLHGVRSKKVSVLMDDKSAQKLHRFAQLAQTVPPTES